MHGFIIGVIAAVVVWKIARRRCGGGGHGRRGWGGGWRGRRRWLFEALDTTPEQEKVILAAFDELRGEARGARGEWQDTRRDVAESFGDEVLDAEKLGNLFARHDEVLERMRKAFVGALAKVHDVLDERQRARLRELVASRAGRGFAFGPYR